MFYTGVRNSSDTCAYHCVTETAAISYNCDPERESEPEVSVWTELLAGKHSVNDMNRSHDLTFLFPLDFH